MKVLRILKETFFSSLPLAAVMVIVCVFIAPFEDPFNYVKITIGYAGVVVGQSLFLVGLDASILPIGKILGESLIKLKKAVFIIVFGILFGLLATVAEPALSVLASQTNMIMPVVNNTVLIWIMGTGVGVFVGFALFRILKSINIKIIFAALYGVIFLLVIFVPNEFIALAFDGSGATTGDISVPFILALGMGVSLTMSKRKTNEETFGIIGLASVGPILAVFIYGIILKSVSGGTIPVDGVYNPGTAGALELVTSNLLNVTLALLPVIVLFLPFQFFLVKLSKKKFSKILLGAIPVFIGLFIFLFCIDYGFAYAAKYIGQVFLDPTRGEWFKWLLLAIGFVLGMAITLSEPAVTVLGEQLEEITNGHIKKMTIRMTLAIGIGVAAVLSIVKILIPEIEIIWMLAPLYAIALIMMIFSSKMFVGLAFDSGGVSGGALTSAFLTPLTLGIAQAISTDARSILINGFGIIAFISVTPLIAVQTLGLLYEAKFKKSKKQAEELELAAIGEILLESENNQEKTAAKKKTKRVLNKKTKPVLENKKGNTPSIKISNEVVNNDKETATIESKEETIAIDRPKDNKQETAVIKDKEKATTTGNKEKTAAADETVDSKEEIAVDSKEETAVADNKEKETAIDKKETVNPKDLKGSEK